MRTRLAASVAVTAALAGLAAGCGSSGPGKAKDRPTGAQSRLDTGRPSQAGAHVRVCGYMTVGSFTASDVEMVGMTCPQAAQAVKAYLSGHPVPRGLRAHESCQHKRRGAPPGTEAYCYVNMRSASKGIRFLKGGHRGRPAPDPVTRLEPGDDRNFGREAH